MTNSNAAAQVSVNPVPSISAVVFTMPQLVEAKTLPTRIKAWGKSAHESQLELVALAIQCLLHFHMHSDATAASMLVKETPLSMRKQALIAWFKASAPLSYSDKTGEFTKDKTKGAIPLYQTVLHDGSKVQNEKALPFIKTALDKPFYDMFKEPKVELFDEALAKPFKTLLNKYKTAKEADLVQQSEKVRSFMEKVRLLQVEAEEIQEGIDTVKKEETISGIKADVKDAEFTEVDAILETVDPVEDMIAA